VPQRTGKRLRVWRVVIAVVIVSVAAAVVGVLVGRATKAGEKTRPAASWQPLPEAPIVGRLGPAAVWTGTEMIIWGGTARSGKIESGYEGAAYNSTARTWRTIAPSPPGVEGGAAVAWTGDGMVVWASNSPDGPVGGAVYDPATDSWRRLPAGPLGKREGYASAWTGKELIIVGGSLGDTLAKPVAAALDPQTASWRLLPADPATDALREIDLTRAPIAPQQQLQLVGVNGTDLVFSTHGLANVRIFIVRYDPTTGSWSTKGAFAPFPVPDGAYTQTAWLGDRYVAADGSSGLQIYSVDTDTWQTITPGASPLNSREGSAIVWTGTELIAWSGTVYERFNPTPADGASLTLGS